MGNFTGAIDEIATPKSKQVNEIKLQKAKKCAELLEKAFELEEVDDSIEISIRENDTTNGIVIIIEDVVIEFFASIDIFKDILNYCDSISCDIEPESDEGVILKLNIDNIFSDKGAIK